MDEQWIQSVGIDVGTSTTKMIVSRLRLGRMSSTFSLPRYQIVERQLLYASEVHSTPLIGFDEIDAEGIGAILQEEYRKAQISLSSIKSGAVIITGETASKKNAQHIVHLLAERSGDFVVATAGADLEGVLAGKGAGAEKRSQTIQGTIVNVDIGGGTANAAYFQRGRAIATVTFHVGGRLIRLDQQDMVTYVSPNIQAWLSAKGLRITVGQRISLAEISEVARQMACSMLDYLTGKERQISGLLVVGPQLRGDFPVEELTVSGGVGKLMEGAPVRSMADVSRYGDFGPLLGYVLQQEREKGTYAVNWLDPEQTVRATVIGAGMQSTEISGSTVHIKPELLPIKNIPILKLELTQEQLANPAQLHQEVAAIYQLGERLFDKTTGIPFALAISGIGYCSYALLQTISQELSDQYRHYFAESQTMVVICETDMAKALGQALALRCKGAPEIICIDQVRVEYGDYIDLGEPISGTIIPVVVKTLAFDEKA
ncbi:MULTISPECIES: ethanolamine ammonia-lyase reactivating factor EutA [Brevibacillus]|jgi:Ethanolamine utilization protein, possible chaperonin protecting lyase from inhibition|uniref:Reactivating factor for ethanolamine ammonia lyase n=1 Tax=Brevibacillus parabrevis TaxID=54914 RepID=A0A4Y3PIW8_BREPA|nr:MULTISPECIES: ethanolamine ammonia-lyase reactivating factor EutA [Brevibacillus]MBU8713464.1 ethanolamine ammonia-lyase reactivating factor EutA [Brevibacillus parabrevis]MDH6351090.1 ethanolamine utilization protein EutA [Brevibacillus sp. 1238]MDR4997660.1 ethanolamine ammonia-lyase reactivating factor EutA [Brevibacillus parabrevis]RNB97151.1 ethanolamine utilization protein [Brevibacillus parabrevis]UED68875.1 ethanolamine ammonia-lyase reactivating factor EutA [Brevibacillus sp. HD3.3